MKDTVMVFTSKPIETIIEEGGSGNWGANKNRLASCKYLLATKSDTLAAHFSNNDVQRGTGFLIGKVLKVTDSPNEDGRYVIQLSEYAETNWPNAWLGNRNPVTYTNIKELEKTHRFSVEKLAWKPFPQDGVERLDTIKPLTIEEAKHGLAKGLKIPVTCIEIKIIA